MGLRSRRLPSQKTVLSSEAQGRLWLPRCLTWGALHALCPCLLFSSLDPSTPHLGRLPGRPARHGLGLNILVSLWS